MARAIQRVTIALVVTLVLGCGRIGFQKTSASSDATADVVADTAPDTAMDSGMEAGPNDGALDTGDGAEPRCGPIDVFIGIETESTTLLWRFDYVPGAAAKDALTRAQEWTVEEVSVAPPSSSLRGISAMPDGRILLADVRASNLVFLDPAAGLREVVSLDTTAPDAPQNVHGACASGPGRVIVGEIISTSEAGAHVAEYDTSGTYVRPVATHTLTGGALSECWSVNGDASLLYTDTETAGGSDDGHVVRIDRDGSKWVERERFMMADFDGGAGTWLWSVLAHSDGSVYIGPAGWGNGAGRIARVIRCPAGSLLASRCETVSDDVPEDGPLAGFVGGLGEVPCSNQLLFVTERSVHRLDLDTGAHAPLFDVSAVVPEFRIIRKLIVRARSDGGTSG